MGWHIQRPDHNQFIYLDQYQSTKALSSQLTWNRVVERRVTNI